MTFQLICCFLEMEGLYCYSESADTFQEGWWRKKNRGECLRRLQWKCMCENLRDKKNLGLQPYLFLLLLNFATCRVGSLYTKPHQGEVLHSSAEKPNKWDKSCCCSALSDYLRSLALPLSNSGSPNALLSPTGDEEFNIPSSQPQTTWAPGYFLPLNDGGSNPVLLVPRRYWETPCTFLH